MIRFVDSEVVIKVCEKHIEKTIKVIKDIERERIIKVMREIYREVDK